MTINSVSQTTTNDGQVVASDLSASAVPIEEIDWSVKTAVVLGNEERGISDSMRNMADATFVIPMRGFVRSFNMSVACSIIVAHLSAIRCVLLWLTVLVGVELCNTCCGAAIPLGIWLT